MIIFFPRGACIKLIDACLVLGTFLANLLSQLNIFKLLQKCNISRSRIEQLGSSFGFVSLESPMIVAGRSCLLCIVARENHQPLTLSDSPAYVEQKNYANFNICLK